MLAKIANIATFLLTHLFGRVRMPRRSPLMVNLGCGPEGSIDGFINIDNSPSVLLARFPRIKFLLFKLGVISKQQYRAGWRDVVFGDVSRGLRFESDSVDKLYSSHFLEHLERDKGRMALHEAYRVLKPGGVMRLVVPDLLWHAYRYVETTRDLISGTCVDFTPDVHDEFLQTVYGAYLNRSRFGAEHCYMYDLPSLGSLCREIGFREIRHCEFRQGLDNELAQYDSRPTDSLHLELIK
jgi:SAM-dependent methyltransferase